MRTGDLFAAIATRVLFFFFFLVTSLSPLSLKYTSNELQGNAGDLKGYYSMLWFIFLYLRFNFQSNEDAYTLGCSHVQFHHNALLLGWEEFYK